jgi:tetratricopeptide (TPR) repeat protein
LALSNLGLISLQQGQLEEAIKQFEVAIGFLRRTNESASEASTRNSLGDAYRAANQTRDALRSYLSALSLAEFRGDRSNQFRAIDGLVAVYSQLGQPRAALDLLRDRLELAQQNPRQQLNTARLLAEFFVQMGDRNQAALYFQRAIAIAQQLEDTQQEGLLINRQASLGLTP